MKAPPLNSKPGGRPVVWIGVFVVCLIVLAAFFARPMGSGANRDQFSGSAGPVAAQQSATQPAGSENGVR